MAPKEWLVAEADGESAPTKVEALTAGEAAEEAVERWHDSGMWAGEVVPSHVDVDVWRPVDFGTRWRLRVIVDWSPVFTAVRLEET